MTWPHDNGHLFGAERHYRSWPVPGDPEDTPAQRAPIAIGDDALTPESNAGLAGAITKAASRQTYYTIRFLVDRHRREDALRAYAYFRWVDDVLDGEDPIGEANAGAGSPDRVRFLERQASILGLCLRGGQPSDATAHESMLVELFRHADLAEWGLEAYLRHMMLVMDFDVRRRGRLITQAELDTYTGWLSTAVTGAMHYFISGERAAPADARSYLAVSGAHILHMLRDTFEDLHAGYFNVPREVLEAHSMGPTDVRSDPYRQWVADRVRLAKGDLDAGSSYFSRVPNLRHRMAGLAYIARFRWLVDAIASDGFILRPSYDERPRTGSAIRTGREVLAPLVGFGEPARQSSMGHPPGRPS